MRKHRGFTMIEIIVAIVIIVILMSMLVVGLRIVSASSKEKTTRVTLENAMSMLREFEQTAGASRLPTEAIPAPDELVREGLGGRDHNSVKKTALVYSLLRAVPKNKSSMDQLPADQLLIVNYATGASAPVLLDAWDNPILYVPGPNVSTVDNPPWEDRYGLRQVHMADDTTLERVVSPGGIDLGAKLYPSKPDFSDAAAVSRQITRLRHFRPFFASAGPDGDFRTHDDNIYSFEN